MTSSILSEPIDDIETRDSQLDSVQPSEEPPISINANKLKRSRIGKHISYIWDYSKCSFNERKSDQSGSRLWHCQLSEFLTIVKVRLQVKNCNRCR